ELQPLSREEGIELALGVDAELGRGRAVQFWEQAKGSPFWLESLARTGGSAAGAGELLTVPLRGAGADAGSVLGLLSVVGRPVSVTSAAAVLDWPPPRLEAGLRDLVRRGVAGQCGNTARLTHALIREAAVAQLPGEACRQLHR